MINIQLGRMGSDCTSPYYVTISKPMCVGDFIEEWLKENPHEWGRFGIFKRGEIFGHPVWEYRYGQLLSKPDDEWFSRKIKEVKGSGGWSNSDFIFILEDEE